MSVCIIYIQAKEKELNPMQLPASLKNTNFFFLLILVYIFLFYIVGFSQISGASHIQV